jgi:hypothetical protein
MRLGENGTHQTTGIVRKKSFRGSLCRVEVEIQGSTLNFEFPSATSLPETGESISLSFNPEEVIQILL